MITTIIVSVLVFIIIKIVWGVLKYYSISRKIVKLPSLSSRTPIMRMFRSPSSYDDVFPEFFDKNGVPHKAMGGVINIDINLIAKGIGFNGEPKMWFSDPDAIRIILTDTATFPKYAPTYEVLGCMIGDSLLTLRVSTSRN